MPKTIQQMWEQCRDMTIRGSTDQSVVDTFERFFRAGAAVMLSEMVLLDDLKDVDEAVACMERWDKENLDFFLKDG